MVVLYFYIVCIIYIVIKKRIYRKKINVLVKKDFMSKMLFFELGFIGIKNDFIIKIKRKIGRLRECFNSLWGKLLLR